jgi:hypothetical protein
MVSGQQGTQKAAAYDRKVLEDAHARAGKVYQEARKQADIVYEEAKKAAADKATRQLADQAHKEALKQAEKLRDAIINEGMALFTATWKKVEKDAEEAVASAKARGEEAGRVFKEAKKRADATHDEAKKSGDKMARQEADKTHKEAIKQAGKDYQDSTGKSR